MSSSQILIYSGRGVSEGSRLSLQREVQKAIDPQEHRVELAPTLQRAFSDPRSVKALMIPGGMAPDIMLGSGFSEGVQTIKELVQGGTSFWGMCAGAMVVSGKQHSRLDPHRITTSGARVGEGFFFQRVNDTYHNLYPGEMAAPLFAVGPRAAVREKSWVHMTTVRQAESGATFRLPNIFGPAFIDAAETPGAQVIATYPDSTDITMMTHVGNGVMKHESSIKASRLSETVLYTPEGAKGRYLLSACHVEIDPVDVLSHEFKSKLQISSDEQKSLIKELTENQSQRKELFRQRLHTLGLELLPL